MRCAVRLFLEEATPFLDKIMLYEDYSSLSESKDDLF